MNREVFSVEDAIFQGDTGPWEIVIGLEVHAQIISDSKLFSGSSTVFGAAPNTQVSFLDAGFPGILPILNQRCIEQAVKTGLGLQGRINTTSHFDRKSYFYPDLPTGYQISQFTCPLVEGGFLEVERKDGVLKSIGITRLHVEQDAGKSLHDLFPSASGIDLNRAGIGLMEIVSEPDIRTIEEAALYVKKLRTLLRCLGTCDGNMEEGSLRVDANVSVRRPGQPLGTRAEIKNLNSVRFLQQALTYEIKRQVTLLEAGDTLIQETRLFDTNVGETRSMRAKEDAADYRYFPDPDLLPLVLRQDWIEALRSSIPELPDEKKKRFEKAFGLSSYDAGLLVAEAEISTFFEEGVASLKKGTPKLYVNWLMGDFFGALNRDGLSITESPLTPSHLVELVELIADGTISGKIAKDLFQEMWETGSRPEALVEAKGLRQVSDGAEILRIIDGVLAKEPEKVAEYKEGKEKLFGYFVGLVMKEMKGRGNPSVVNELLKNALKD